MLTVSDDDLIRAMHFVWTRLKLVVEPTGVLGLAAVFNHRHPVQGTRGRDPQRRKRGRGEGRGVVQAVLRRHDPTQTPSPQLHVLPRGASLDFGGIHLACLAGDNGHGKSALLDAMTWALWGRARGDRDDELIALGETEMWVELEFGLGGQRYRVWRQRSKKGPRAERSALLHLESSRWSRSLQRQPSLRVRRFGSETALEGSIPDDSGDWQLLDDGGLRERQAQIIRTLRMEYETFVNSAFLLQGRADSFTVKTASERKQILADILGLAATTSTRQRLRRRLRRARSRRRASRARSRASTPSWPPRRIRSAAAGRPRRRRSRGCDPAENRGGRAGAGAAGRAGAPGPGPAACRSAQPPGPRRARSGRWPQPTRRGHRRGWRSSRRCWRSGTRSRRAGPRFKPARADDAAWNARLLRHTQVSEQVNRARLAVDQARLALEAEQRRLTDRQAELARKVAAGQEQAAVLGRSAGDPGPAGRAAGPARRHRGRAARGRRAGRGIAGTKTTG